ncbi:helix-turn-helix domain-containing protein [Clostridium botulinum]|uniref:helix-turn-helix domain-containing protein n=1 Tax=Clostridium botulinum TaxID=1491 RepID=UPI0013C7CC47|nr:helix-turn-helix domain-containing protein [Clostridium botulinum]MBN1042192.1 helix-turn-helix domain-containing protein [Clostridium botulinum]NFN17425.1 helix-turn-helix domain-containing protein [Clostridium botulinum]NFN48914.1 helix-turn-helix domain-containing protein [Clostridium botulinum]NFO41776.1 helix-turn-helix domain-containing protein [Clostridium botulinum]
MSVSKDFIKFRQHIRTLNISVNEQYLMELFFEYNNSQFGYSFLEFADIMKAFNTTSKNRISATIKKLEKKKLIEVDRTYKNNRYKIIGIEKFINTSDKKDNKPLNSQMDFYEITKEEKKIINLGFTQKQAKSLLKVANDKIDKIISAFNYAASKGAKNIYAYTITALKGNYAKIKTTKEEIVKKLKFNNFEAREYDYDDLEKKLLGWENNSVNIEEESTFNLKRMLELI